MVCTTSRTSQTTLMSRCHCHDVTICSERMRDAWVLPRFVGLACFRVNGPWVLVAFEDVQGFGQRTFFWGKHTQIPSILSIFDLRLQTLDP